MKLLRLLMSNDSEEQRDKSLDRDDLLEHCRDEELQQESLCRRGRRGRGTRARARGVERERCVGEESDVLAKLLCGEEDVD
jgi:hypothetical protein